MGRHEKPINPQGPIADFAIGLRALRAAAHLRYWEMAKMTHYRVTTLSTAASGKVMPSWPVTQAYVKACGGDLGYWYDQWRAASAAWKRFNCGS